VLCTLCFVLVAIVSSSFEECIGTRFFYSAPPSRTLRLCGEVIFAAEAHCRDAEHAKGAQSVCRLTPQWNYTLLQRTERPKPEGQRPKEAIDHGQLTTDIRSLLLKLQRRGVHAIPQSGGFWTVVEHVAEVRVAPLALHFRSRHAETAISLCADVCF
jgi:hypothetical protein